MSEKDQYKNRIELLQGTLDMLILQTPQWGPQHGYGIVQALRCDPEMCFRWKPDHCIRLSIDWSVRAGCSLNGSSQRAKQRARYYRITAKEKKFSGEESRNNSEALI